jgi:glycine/D-amino acid oxidase-like deaminating enzyme
MTAASATHHRDLRTGQSIWTARRRPAISSKPLARDIACDAVVVGAGISGALIAEALSEAGLRTVIVDRRGPAEGSTAASTAMLQYELDTPLSLMAARIGREKAERIWRRSRQAVDALRERTERLGLAVDGATRGSIYLDGNVLDAGGLAREAKVRDLA